MSEEKSRLREAVKKIEELEAELKSVRWSSDLFKSGMDIACEVGGKAQTKLTAAQKALDGRDKILGNIWMFLNTLLTASEKNDIKRGWLENVGGQLSKHIFDLIGRSEVCGTCNDHKFLTVWPNDNAKRVEDLIKIPCPNCQEKDGEVIEYIKCVGCGVDLVRKTHVILDHEQMMRCYSCYKENEKAE